MNGTGKNAKRLAARWAPWLLLALLLAGMAAVQGLAFAYDVSYEITNGDFQNYNPVRHLLAGQAPYADFTVYLGAGELYSVGAMLLVLGNTFANSVFAANFLTWLLVLAVSAAVLGDARAARGLTALLSGYFLLAVRGVPLPLAGLVRPLLGAAADVGNSARMLRAAALPLAVLVIAAVLGAWRRRGGRPARLPDVLIPIVAGALVPWSNDMGAAMYIAVALAYGMFLLRRHWPHALAVLRGTLAYIGISAAGLGVSVLLVSHGHPFAWLRQTRGAAAFQSWYYGQDAGAQLCTPGDLVLSPCFWLLLALAAVAAVLTLRAGREDDALRAAGVFALCAGMALWEPLYAIGSGGRSGPQEGGQALLAVLVPVLAAGAVRALLRRRAAAWKRALPAAGIALAAVCLAVGLYGQWQHYRAGRGELQYVPELGGWLDDRADKLAAERALTGDAPVFSTYASGLEAMTGQLQPTGTDYIIHVLGDRQRTDYLQLFQIGFENGLFTYACTPSPKVATYERWARNANWWFYRELYRYWEPVSNTYGCGGMHLFWTKGGDHDRGVPVTLTLAQTAPGTWTLTADADADFSGVVDVRLDYAMTAPPFTLHSYLFVDCVTENALWAAAGRGGSASFFLPGQGSAAYIPVTVANGSGTVTLRALPAGADLQVQAAAEGTFEDWYYFFE